MADLIYDRANNIYDDVNPSNPNYYDSINQNVNQNANQNAYQTAREQEIKINKKSKLKLIKNRKFIIASLAGLVLAILTIVAIIIIIVYFAGKLSFFLRGLVIFLKAVTIRQYISFR